MASAIHDLNESWRRESEGTAIIDRLINIAVRDSALRVSVAQSLAAFVRDHSPSTDTLSKPPEEDELHGSDSLQADFLEKYRTPEVIQYALRKLGEAPLEGAAKRGEMLDLRGIVVTQWLARSKTFRKVDLTDAILYKSSLIGSYFLDCDLTGTVLSESRMCGATIRGTSLRGARFLYAELGAAALEAVQLKNAVFDRAFLQRSTWQSASEAGDARWNGACIDDIIGPASFVEALRRGGGQGCGSRVTDHCAEVVMPPRALSRSLQIGSFECISIMGLACVLDASFVPMSSARRPRRCRATDVRRVRHGRQTPS
ncbi:MAG TPA: pentapeptide repeat-containing protein [Candidatus Eisenbacteria bacterium]|nr:pentapeptide repeat-containing protein [Candidatus Eisenbacteria bacterium]